MTSDSDKARAILNASAIFNTGCVDTNVHMNPPETCEECSASFVRIVGKILSGEVVSVPYIGPAPQPAFELQ